MANLTAERAIDRLKANADPERVPQLQRFFKTGPGEYAEGDQFLGLRVPAIRELSRDFRGMELEELESLLYSPWHEARLLALIRLVHRYQRASNEDRQAIYDLYLRNRQRIDNWDLVDVSAEHIVGAHLAERDLEPLLELADDDLLWSRRIAVIATFYFVRRDRFEPTLILAERLLTDSHDLIHKAVGWMLREVGKRDESALEAFLGAHYHDMPRQMLRYAIERLPQDRREAYLRGTAT